MIEWRSHLGNGGLDEATAADVKPISPLRGSFLRADQHLFIRIGPYPSNMRFLPQWSVSLASSTCDHPVLCNCVTAVRKRGGLPGPG